MATANQIAVERWQASLPARRGPLHTNEAAHTDAVVETARQGVAILGPGTPAAIRLENAARFLDFVGESLARAAEQAREVLYTNAETTSGGTAEPSSACLG